MQNAACTNMGPDLFYDSGRIREAKAVCRDCPARISCLDRAITNRERWGVWGGKTPEERGLKV